MFNSIYSSKNVVLRNSSKKIVCMSLFCNILEIKYNWKIYFIFIFNLYLFLKVILHIDVNTYITKVCDLLKSLSYSHNWDV